MSEQEIVNQKAKIVRNKHTKAATLEVEHSGEWILYMGTSIKNINYDVPFLNGKGKGKHSLIVSANYRSYFCFETKKGRSILADDHLPMAGGYNFRDLGGIKTKDGKHIKWGKIFRADEMSNLTEEDTTYLSSIPIRTVVDFRAQAEVKRSPDKLPSTARFLYPIAITPGNLSSEGIQANLLKTDVTQQMKNMNRALVSDPDCVRAFRSLFAILQNTLSAPALYHCTAGKDRTGMATALILTALGVDDKTIMNDYMASKVFLTEKYSAFIEKHPSAEALFTVKKRYLLSGINQIKRDHGTVEDFLRKELNVDIEKFRQMYLID